MIPILDIETPGLERRWAKAWSADRATLAAVEPIVAEVRRGGDRALRRWARKLDGLERPLRVKEEEIEAAWRAARPGLRRALLTAHGNIRKMAMRQRPRSWMRRLSPGVKAGQVVRALESAGCYVPAGRYPLPSTVLMTAGVARAAGVGRVVVVCPRPEGAVLAAARVAGATEVYRVGGAQAIAALAYGTETIAAVDKIVGPGNRYVTAAKQMVRADCEIDLAAGPSEVLLVAGRGAKAEWLAADLVAQAEHDPDAVAWLATDSRALAKQVQRAAGERAAGRGCAAEALRRRGAIVVAPDLRRAVELANRLAPEHLGVPREALGWVENAGSVFVGEYSPVAAGDYATGPNHVLPTAGGARARGGLSAADFVKVITVQELTKRGLAGLAPAVTTLARAEGLGAHAASVEERLL